MRSARAESDQHQNSAAAASTHRSALVLLGKKPISRAGAGNFSSLHRLCNNDIRDVEQKQREMTPESRFDHLKVFLWQREGPPEVGEILEMEDYC